MPAFYKHQNIDIWYNNDIQDDIVTEINKDSTENDSLEKIQIITEKTAIDWDYLITDRLAKYFHTTNGEYYKSLIHFVSN